MPNGYNVDGVYLGIKYIRPRGYITDFTLSGGVDISWTDPDVVGWAKTVVRYSDTSYPTSISDGTLAVEETTKDQYSSSPYSLSLDEGTYYFSIFALDGNNDIIDKQTDSILVESDWEPDANTVVWYKLDGNANDSSGNNRNGSYPNGNPTWDMNAGQDGCWNGGKAVRFPYLGSYNVFTVSLWVKGAGVAFYLTDYGSGDRNNMDASVGNAGGNVTIYNGSNYKRQGWGATALADLATTRHNVIYVKNNSNWAGYVDGQKVGTWSNGTTIKMNSNSQIGYHPTSSSTGSGDRWVDNFIIQSNAWGDAEALAYYNKTIKYYR